MNSRDIHNFNDVLHEVRKCYMHNLFYDMLRNALLGDVHDPFKDLFRRTVASLRVASSASGSDENCNALFAGFASVALPVCSTILVLAVANVARSGERRQLLAICPSIQLLFSGSLQSRCRFVLPLLRRFSR